MTQQFAVGIDLGTTFSSLAYVDSEHRLQALRLPDGGFTLASAIYFRGPEDIVVGTEALSYSVIEADCVARAFKRQMGDPHYSFPCHGRSFRPEELSALVVRRLLDAASHVLGPIEEIGLSVPFVFDEVRRRATLDAARIAGVGKVHLVDEPVAAALAYAHTLLRGQGLFGGGDLGDVYADETVLVYDLGGGTFDATVMRLAANGKFEVLATDGDERLGGEDWDAVLLEMLYEDHRRNFAHTHWSPSREVEQELRIKAEEAKRTLSGRPRAEVVYDYEGRECKVPVARGDFERRSAHLLDRSRHTMESMLERRKLSWSHIDRVLVVGGSSRMPMVVKMLERTLKRPLDVSLPPDIAIAQGAALYAAFQAGGRINVETVNSHALGMLIKEQKTNRLKNDPLINANEKTQTAVKRRYRILPGSEGLTLTILLGDSEDPSKCKFLGKGRIAKVPSRTSPKDVVEVTFGFLRNGLLHVTAVYQSADGRPQQQVEFDLSVQGQMTEEEVVTATATFRGISIE